MQTDVHIIFSFLLYLYEFIISDFYHRYAIRNFHENIINSELYNFFKHIACL